VQDISFVGPDRLAAHAAAQTAPVDETVDTLTEPGKDVCVTDRARRDM